MSFVTPASGPMRHILSLVLSACLLATPVMAADLPDPNESCVPTTGSGVPEAAITAFPRPSSPRRNSRALRFSPTSFRPTP